MEIPERVLKEIKGYIRGEKKPKNMTRINKLFSRLNKEISELREWVMFQEPGCIGIEEQLLEEYRNLRWLLKCALEWNKKYFDEEDENTFRDFYDVGTR